jgi:alpha-mannosidase
VTREAYALNVPLRALPVAPAAGDLPRAASFLEVDAANVIIEAVKQAEDGSDLIVRLYECENRPAQAVVRTGFAIASAAEVDLMEENPAPLALEDGAVRLAFRPFEIKTLRVTPA